MLKYYFKTAWRNITNNKLFAILNIAGLAFGLSVCIILFAFVTKELSFDRMYPNAKNIYRVNMETTAEYNFGKWSTLPNAVGPAILKDIPQVKSTTRLIKDGFGATASLTVDGKNFSEKGLYLADSSVFRIFDFSFIEGDIHSVFSQPKSIVLSQSAKQKLFGNESSFGKVIYLNNRDTLHVSGVYQDLPENSTIDCDMVYNIMDSWMGKNTSWSNASFESYCLLQPNANVDDVQKMATALIDKYVEKGDQYYSRFMFQPLAKIHLYSTDLRQGYSSRMGNINNVKGLSFLALLVLLIACINYMNLATARSQKRAKGVGMNKVLGANFRQTLLIFYLETGIVSFVSISIGYLLAVLLTPLFKTMTGIELNDSNLYSTTILFSLLIIWFLVTIISGSYPAFSMSRISPLILMSKSKPKHAVENFVRKGLVVFQFVSSVILIIAVITIWQQMKFIRNKDLGYNPKGVVALSISSVRNKEQIKMVISNLKKLASIEDVSAVQTIPGDIESGRSVRKLITDKQGFPIKSCHADGPVVNTMQLNLLAGADLPVSISKEDTTCYVVINETVANYLGFKTPQDAIGKYIITEMNGTSIVKGVVKNFNYQSLRDEVGGYVYYEMNDAPEGLGTLLVRYNTANLSLLIDQVQDVFKTDLPSTAFEYQFLDRHIQTLYSQEQHTANASMVFSVLAIFIACLGLFGLAAFTAEQRTKEIGVRKVLGATALGITKLLTMDFLKLVMLAFVIASPIAWWLMNKWLLGFAYRIDMGWLVFVIAGLSVVFISLATISLQSVKAALANPVKSLRTE